MDNTTATILANQARQIELKTSLAAIRAEIDTTANLNAMLSTANGDAQRRYQQKAGELAALEAGAGPGLTQDFGNKTVVTQRAELERDAGQSAAIDFIKANPGCTEAEAIAAWTDAAAQVRQDRARILQDPAGVLEEYQANAAAARAIPEPTWEAFRAFVVATDKTALMGM